MAEKPTQNGLVREGSGERESWDMMGRDSWSMTEMMRIRRETSMVEGRYNGMDICFLGIKCFLFCLFLLFLKVY